MNPPDSEIENLLRTLRPRPPARDLEEGIAAELAARAVTVVKRVPAAAVIRRGPAQSPRWWQGWGWAFAGACTAAAVIASIEHFSPRAAVAGSPAPGFETALLEYVDASAEIVSTEDEGLFITDEAEPVRRVRFTSYESHVWTNPATGARMEYTVPREDIRLTPIALQ